MVFLLQGPSFSGISEVTQLEYASAICSLVASSQRYAGLWRLKEVSGLCHSCALSVTHKFTHSLDIHVAVSHQSWICSLNDII